MHYCAFLLKELSDFRQLFLLHTITFLVKLNMLRSIHVVVASWFRIELSGLNPKLVVFFLGQDTVPLATLMQKWVSANSSYPRESGRNTLSRLIPIRYSLNCGRRGGLMVSALDSGASGPGSSPGRGHCVVFLGKSLYSHSASLHPGV